MKELEKLLKALANKRRIAILKVLKENGAVSVGDIASEIKLSFKSTSKHLAILSSLNIVDKEQVGLQVFYKLGNKQDPIIKFILSLL